MSTISLVWLGMLLLLCTETQMVASSVETETFYWKTAENLTMIH